MKMMTRREWLMGAARVGAATTAALGTGSGLATVIHRENYIDPDGVFSEPIEGYPEKVRRYSSYIERACGRNLEAKVVASAVITAENEKYSDNLIVNLAYRWLHEVAESVAKDLNGTLPFFGRVNSYGPMQIAVDAADDYFEMQKRFTSRQGLINHISNPIRNIENGIIFFKSVYKKILSRGYTGDDALRMTAAAYNGGMQRAIIAGFQSEYNKRNNGGLIVDGKLGAQTLQAMQATGINIIHMPKNREEYRALHKKLKKAGYRLAMPPGTEKYADNFVKHYHEYAAVFYNLKSK